jgi:ubiquitin C-terminal hydrolase
MNHSMLFGLSNSGSMCYQNSAIQTLIRVPNFIKFYATTYFAYDKSPLSYQLFHIAIAINSKNNISLSNLLAKDENGKVTLENFKGAMDKIIHNYRDKTIQHDAIEYTSHILNILLEELELGMKQYPNIINSIFRITFKNTSTCRKCGIENSLDESDLMLKLNLELYENSDNNYTLGECLDSFEKKEEFDKKCDNNKCEFFNTNTKATKQIKIGSLPDAIFIHFKRTANSKNKIVVFPNENFEIGRFFSNFSNKKDNAEYSLVSVINYLGEYDDNKQGHYYTYSRDQLYGTWWEINDDHKKIIDDPENICSKNAVLLAYVKSELLPKVKEKIVKRRSQVKGVIKL